MSPVLSLLSLVQPALQNLLSNHEEEFNSLYSSLPLVSQEIKGWWCVLAVELIPVCGVWPAVLQLCFSSSLGCWAEGKSRTKGSLLAQVCCRRWHFPPPRWVLFFPSQFGECIVLMCLDPALLVHFSTLHLYFRITRILLKACFSFCSQEAEDRVSEEKCMVNPPSLLSLRALCKYNFHMTLSERYCSCFRADTEVAGRPREGRLHNTDV